MVAEVLGRVVLARARGRPPAQELVQGPGWVGGPGLGQEPVQARASAWKPAQAPARGQVPVSGQGPEQESEQELELEREPEMELATGARAVQRRAPFLWSGCHLHRRMRPSLWRKPPRP